MIPLSLPNISGKEWENVKQCIDTGWISTAGSFVDRFESEFAEYIGTKSSVSVVNGTAALHIALQLLGVEHDDLVKYIKDSPKNGRYNYAIITQNSEHHIGNGSLHSIDVNSKNFTIGWFVGEKEFWGGHYSSLTIFNLLKIRSIN